MKTPTLLFIAVASLMTACQNNSKTEKTIDSAAKSVVTAVKPVQECYSSIKNRDTAILSMVLSGTKLTGSLSYNLYEKDKNSGTLAGTVKGDTLLADYTFNSEGVQSVRQVAFLKKGDQLLEGFGDVEEQNGKVVFKDFQNLKFEQIMVFDKTNCK